MKVRLQKRIPAFSLVEMGIVLIIMGAVLSVVWPMIHTLQKTQAQRLTQEHQELITRSLAAYVLKEKHLPCPAQSSDGVATNGCSGVSIGIVPFQTLGLPEKIAKNGSGGQYFTYAVDGVLTRHFSYLNIITPDSEEITFCNTAKDDTFIKLIKNGQNIPISPNDMIAFVLISHEKDGAFNAGFTRTPLRSPIPEQTENTNDDDTFDVSEGVDRVSWITRNNLMAQYAKEVCR